MLLEPLTRAKVVMADDDEAQIAYSDPTGVYLVGSSDLREKVYGQKSQKRCYHDSLECARKCNKGVLVVEFEKEYAISCGRAPCKMCCA